MDRCAWCGFDLSVLNGIDGVLFCPHCGRRIGEQYLETVGELLNQSHPGPQAVRAINTLRSKQVTTVEDLVSHSRSELLEFRNLGIRGLDLIEQALRQRGLSLRE